MYALILLALAPFILLGAVMALSSWEERILPSPERAGAAARNRPDPAGPGLGEAPGHHAPVPPRPGPRQPEQPSPVIARYADHDRLDCARPAGFGVVRPDPGHLANRHGRSPAHLDLRRRPPGPPRNAHRYPR